MAYQVLARKLRPGNFQEMVGQGHVLKTLTNALDSQRLHHAYLFTGTRGVGKTTIARIFARCLNCEEGVSSKPCGKCSACVEISEGRFIDLIEVDAASRTKVEDTRELLENVQYAPSRGRYKIYLIDEVHMLSNHSFNALLKTLEEPPPHVKFLLATTDPQKLPVTILSRCLQFHLKSLSPQHISDYLQQVLRTESITFEDDAIWQVASAAAGSMRDALTLLDQAISYCEGMITTAAVIEMLGTPSNQIVSMLLDELYARNAGLLISACARASENGQDFGQLIDGLMSAFHRIAITQALPDALDNSFGDLEMLRINAQRFSPEDIQLYYQMCLRGRADLAHAIDPGAMFEMLMIRMLVFSPEGVPGIPVPRDMPKGEKKKPEPLATTPAEATKLSEQPVVATPAVTQPVAPGTTGVPDPAALDGDSWLELYPRLGAGGITGSILGNCVFLTRQGDELRFRLDPRHGALYNEEQRLRIQDLFSAYYSVPVKITIEIGEVQQESPAARDARLKSEARHKLISEFEQDRQVGEILQRFSGTLLVDTIVRAGDRGGSSD